MRHDHTFQIGDQVECILSTDKQNALRARDADKAIKEGRRFFMGRAAAYMHTDKAYVVTGITKTGGLQLRGFAGIVSPRDVRLSVQKVIR